MTPDRALAHGAPLDRPVGWSDWNGDLVIVLNLLLLGWLYARGWQKMQKRCGRGAMLQRKQAICFLAGWLILGAAVISPLDLLSEQLASAHMVQHMLLMTLAAPLLVLGKPGLVCLWGLSSAGRRTVAQLFSRRSPLHSLNEWCWNPLAMWGLFAAVTWVWHIPLFYNAALRSIAVHDWQHASFFLAALLYWRTLIDPLSRRRVAPQLAVLSLFATTLQTTVLGVLMTIAPRPWYSPYAERTPLWDMTPLEDQQLAGLIMWMPACWPYLIAALILLMNCLNMSTSTSTPQFACAGKGTE